LKTCSGIRAQGRLSANATRAESYGKSYTKQLKHKSVCLGMFEVRKRPK